MAVSQPALPTCSTLPGRNCNTSTGKTVMCPVTKDQDICGCSGATKACKPCFDCKPCTHGTPSGGKSVHKTGWMSARCALIDMEDGGKENGIFEPHYSKTDHFNNTGSGQT
eukprot:COSAG06_NODE_237_length_19433_cov_92.613961_22_plen_111_part_00